jgi:hypothetical protein
MKHRKLRIAWSAAWGLVAVLLVALWVTTYDSPITRSASITQKLGVAAMSYSGEVTANVVYMRTSDDVPGWALNVPHWLLSIFAISIGAISWLPFQRFSLRTLLIVTTLVAVGLGLLVWAIEPI